MHGIDKLFGRIYLDTDGLIDLVSHPSNFESDDQKAVLAAFGDEKLTFVSSELTIVEALVHPRRASNSLYEESLMALLTPGPTMILHPVTRSIIDEALNLRVKFNFRTPDAIHIATGMAQFSDFYLTKDRKWLAAGLKCVSVPELAAALASTP